MNEKLMGDLLKNHHGKLIEDGFIYPDRKIVTSNRRLGSY